MYNILTQDAGFIWGGGGGGGWFCGVREACWNVDICIYNCTNMK